MKKFRIIATPPGQAPDWVREEWVGLEMPMDDDRELGVQMGALGGRPENVGGFHVNGQVAIELLEKKSPKAAEWWRENVPQISGMNLVFKQDVCEIV